MKVTVLHSFHGVYAALLSPRTAAGELDLPSYRHQLSVLQQHPLSGYAVNGATGEFTFATNAELEALVKATRDEAPDATVLCGIGAGDVRGTVERGRLAANAGAHAVLLPMPSFFPYRQDDLAAYVSAVADAVEVPIVLYNLPQFTSGLSAATVLALFGKHRNIIGIKDSSGSLDIVRAITEAQLPHARIIGNDGALADALEGSLCDAVVSGVSCTLPELMTALYATAGKGDLPRYRALLDAFIEQLGPLPTPWGLKVTSAVRGFTNASYPFPLSPEREAEAARLAAWFQAWLPNSLA